MAFNKAPTTIWPGYTSDGTNITIPIAYLDGLTSAEANATTGDWRQVVLAFVSRVYSYYASLAAADRPEAVVPGAPYITPVTSGDFADKFRTTYDFTFYNDYGVPNVADEPA